MGVGPGAARRGPARRHRAAFNGESHRFDCKDLVGESVFLYPQTDVFLDLAARGKDDGSDVRYSDADTSVYDLDGKPKVWFTDAGA